MHNLAHLKFSVLIPVYIGDVDLYFSQCLDSVFNQTLTPSEVVIVIDGPISKKLESVVKTFNDSYPELIKVLKLEVNNGLGRALMHGLNFCTSEYIFRMDADDICDLQRFEKQLNLIVSNPKISILGSFIQEFESKKLLRVRGVPLSYYDIQKTLFYRNPFNHMTVLFKKKAILDVGGYQHCPGYEDYYLWVRVLKRHLAMNISDVLVYARTDRGFFKRRSGLSFFLKELSFQIKLFNEGYITFFLFFRNIILRAIPRILPLFIIKGIYTRLLRSKS